MKDLRSLLVFFLGAAVAVIALIWLRPLPQSDTNESASTYGSSSNNGPQRPALTAAKLPIENLPIESGLVTAPAASSMGSAGEAFEDESRFVMQGYPGSRPEAVGPATEALVSVAGGLRKFRLLPNQNGEFQRVYLPLGGGIEAKVKMKRPAGEKVAVSVRDGGLLANGKNAELAQIGADGCVRLAFITEGYQGIHRVTLTAENGETATLDLWAGAELASIQRRK
jgi:hypothetical protein